MLDKVLSYFEHIYCPCTVSHFSSYLDWCFHIIVYFLFLIYIEDPKVICCRGKYNNGETDRGNDEQKGSKDYHKEFLNHLVCLCRF